MGARHGWSSAPSRHARRCTVSGFRPAKMALLLSWEWISTTDYIHLSHLTNCRRLGLLNDFRKLDDQIFNRSRFPLPNLFITDDRLLINGY